MPTKKIESSNRQLAAAAIDEEERYHAAQQKRVGRRLGNRKRTRQNGEEVWIAKAGVGLDERAGCGVVFGNRTVARIGHKNVSLSVSQYDATGNIESRAV